MFLFSRFAMLLGSAPLQFHTHGITNANPWVYHLMYLVGIKFEGVEVLRSSAVNKAV